MKRTIHLAYLYSQEMNTYGDWGNVLCLLQRMNRRGYQVRLTEYHPGDRWPRGVDLIFMGGGQDSGQTLIIEDLHKIASNLRGAIEDGVPALMICGAYQLLGHYFLTAEQQRLEGLGIFDIYTEAETGRMIGNVVIDSPQYGELIGFENHSGRTYLHDGAQALGRVVKGDGNNGTDNTEGVLYRNAIGSYLHGPLLPKNPQLADQLIATAVATSVQELPVLPDKFVHQAREAARQRPR